MAHMLEGKRTANPISTSSSWTILRTMAPKWIVTSTLTAALSLRYGISVSKVFFQARDWLTQQTPFLANVREGAILV